MRALAILLGLLLCARASAQAPAYELQAPRSLADVTPMPPPAPAVYASQADYQQYLGWRLSVLDQRAAQLDLLAHTKQRKRRILWGFIGGGVALAASDVATLAWLMDGEPSRLETRTGIVLSSLCALGGVAGITIALVSVFRRPYKYELREVRVARAETQRALKQEGVALSFSANRLQLRLRF